MRKLILCVLSCACVSTQPSTTGQSSSATTVPPSAGWGDPGTTSAVSADGAVSWCCSTWYVPVVADAGQAIASVVVPIRDNGAANGFPTDGNGVVLVLVSQTATGTTQLGNVASNSSGARQTLTLSLSTPHVVTDSESIVLRAVALSGGALPGPAHHPSEIGAVRVVATTATTARTIRIPGQRGLAQTYAQGIILDAGGVAGVPLPLWSIALDVPRGSRLTGVRARVKDSSSTTLMLITTKSVDEYETGIGGSGTPSSGSGQWQTLSRSMSETDAPGVIFYASVFTYPGSGTGAGHVAWVEEDLSDDAPPN